MAVAAGEPDFHPAQGSRRSPNHHDLGPADQSLLAVASHHPRLHLRFGRLHLVAETIMRGLRSTIALVVVLIGLGAYIYFVTWKTPASDAASNKEKVFQAVQSDKIDDITLKTQTGGTTKLKKENGGWQIVDPVTAKADESEISGMTSNLSSLEIGRVIDENPTNLEQYGLATPRIEVDFKAPEDKEARGLYIGEKSPTGSDLFAKRNDDKKIFLIPAYHETTFSKSSF